MSAFCGKQWRTPPPKLRLQLWVLGDLVTRGGNLDALLATPIRPAAGPAIFLRDIGRIDDATDILTAYAHVNGRRTVYIPVTKRANASTLSVIDEIKAASPDLKKLIPPDIDIRLHFNQSPYVRNSLTGLLFEAGIGTALTGLMVLLFLRDLAQLHHRGHQYTVRESGGGCASLGGATNINIMTLGGLACHSFVARAAAAISAGSIHHDFTCQGERCWIERKMSPLEMKIAVHRVQDIRQHKSNPRFLRLEFDRKRLAPCRRNGAQHETCR